VPTRRSLLSYALGPAVLSAGMPAVNRASARSAAAELVGIAVRGNIQRTMPTCPALARPRPTSGPCIPRRRTARSHRGKARLPMHSPSLAVRN
jgi:hypothetical protein